MPGPSQRSTIGWREWVGLPDLGVEPVKAKIDTGARTSSLHAFDLELTHRDGSDWVAFEVWPVQKSRRDRRRVSVPVLGFREVRSSNGEVQNRPVIRTRLELLGQCWPIEITLTNRDQMGFRMLLGRAALRRRFVIDPGRSFLGGRHRYASPTSEEW